MKTDIALKNEVIEVLLKTFGALETEKFISLIKSSNFDYTEWRKTLWNDKTIDEIHEMAVNLEKRNKGKVRV